MALDSIVLTNRAVGWSPPVFIPHWGSLLIILGGSCVRAPCRASSCVPGGSVSGVQAEGPLRRTPRPGEDGSGRPGPSPEAREALSCGPVGLDGRHSPRRPPAACSSPVSLGLRQRWGVRCGRPLCDRCSIGQLAGVVGEKNVRSCVFTETLVLVMGGVDSGFRIQPHTSVSASRRAEGEGGGLGGVWAPPW